VSEYSQEINYTIPLASNDVDDDGDGFTAAERDCDDSDPTINPSATDICGDGIDQDCDGSDLECVVVNPDSDGDGLTDSDELNTYHTDPNKADTDNDGLIDFDEVITYHTDPNSSDMDGDGFSDGEEVASGFDPTNPDSKPALDSAWNSASDFSAVFELGNGNTGVVETNFDVTPLINLLDGVIGYADTSAGIAAYRDMAMLVRMNENGQFDVRNGSGYDADVVVPYSANSTYHVRMVSDLNAGTYDVWVTPQGGTETQIANDYIFRSDAPLTDDLGKVCLIDSIGEFRVEYHTVATITISVDPKESDDDGDGFTENDGDCNDNNSSIHPDAIDVCGDGIDQDCDGTDQVCPEDIARIILFAQVFIRSRIPSLSLPR